MKVVVGGTYGGYVEWRQRARLSPREAIYVGDDRERLMGLEIQEQDIVRLGRISLETEEVLRTRIRPPSTGTNR